MDWSAIGSWAGVGVTLLVGAYIHGKLAQSVVDHHRRLDKAEENIEDHETRISVLEGRHFS